MLCDAPLLLQSSLSEKSSHFEVRLSLRDFVFMASLNELRLDFRNVLIWLVHRVRSVYDALRRMRSM
jgi:hypothetical protein